MPSGAVEWPAAREEVVRAMWFFAAAVGILGLCQWAAAQSPPPRPYDGIQAGLDAFRLAEEQRQAALSAQLATNDRMRAWSGLPTSGLHRALAITCSIVVAGSAGR